MIYEKNYFSNTVAGTCNNSMLHFKKNTELRSRIFYKVSVDGEYEYKFFFSNNVFSTFYDGSESKANDKGSAYQILNAKAGFCDKEYIDFDGENMQTITFAGKNFKDVLSGEEFWSDSIPINANKKGYLVFEWTVIGKDLPFTPDKLIPAQLFDGEKFILNNQNPQPNMVACNRPIDKKVIFLGDSITQGIGTEFNAYKFWSAQLSKKIVKKHGVWNLGLGYGRAQDIASDKVWLSCAKIADFVNVCCGINDIIQGRTLVEIKNDIKTIVLKLKNAGTKVGIFTIPPFDFQDYKEDVRKEVNEFIFSDIAPLTEYVFDFSNVLADSKNPNKTIYGAHPDNEGCKVVSKKFFDTIDLDSTLK